MEMHKHPNTPSNSNICPSNRHSSTHAPTHTHKSTPTPSLTPPHTIFHFCSNTRQTKPIATPYSFKSTFNADQIEAVYQQQTCLRLGVEIHSNRWIAVTRYVNVAPRAAFSPIGYSPQLSYLEIAAWTPTRRVTWKLRKGSLVWLLTCNYIVSQ